MLRKVNTGDIAKIIKRSFGVSAQLLASLYDLRPVNANRKLAEELDCFKHSTIERRLKLGNERMGGSVNRLWPFFFFLDRSFWRRRCTGCSCLFSRCNARF